MPLEQVLAATWFTGLELLLSYVGVFSPLLNAALTELGPHFRALAPFSVSLRTPFPNL